MPIMVEPSALTAPPEKEIGVHGANDGDDQGAVPDGAHIFQPHPESVGRLEIKNPKHEQQAGGKGIFKNSSLKNGTDDNQGSHYGSHEAGAFGLTVAQKQQTYRDPHHGNQKQQR